MLQTYAETDGSDTVWSRLAVFTLSSVVRERILLQSTASHSDVLVYDSLQALIYFAHLSAISQSRVSLCPYVFIREEES